MIKWLKKISDLARLDINRGIQFEGVLPLYNLHLSGVTNPFNAELLWQGSSALVDGIIAENKNNGNVDKSLRLFDALSRHTAGEYVEEEATQELVRERRIFSDVVIWISRRHWDIACEDRGDPIRQLVTNLQLKHERSFTEEKFWRQRRPHYCVMPADDLSDDTVLCQFGMGVFIPDHKDQQLASLSIQLDEGESANPLPDWIFFENGQEVRRPCAWYAGQHSFTLAANRTMSCLPASVWPDKGDGNIRLLGKQEAPLILEAKPDTQFWRMKCTRPIMGGDFEFLFDHIATRQSMWVIVGPVQGAQIDPNKKSSGTIGGYSDNEFPALSLVGITLPTAQLKLPGMAGWQLFLHPRQGFVSTTEDGDTIRLFGLVGDSRLFWQKADEAVEELATFPFTINLGDTDYLIDTLFAKESRYVLALPVPSLYSIRPDTRYLLGRSPVLTEAGRQEDITLKQLEISGSLFDKEEQSLRLANGTSLTLNHLLSAEQVSLEWTDEGLFVSQLSHSQDSFLIDTSGNEKKRLPKKTRASGYLLMEEYLVTGPYVFKLMPPDLSE